MTKKKFNLFPSSSFDRKKANLFNSQKINENTKLHLCPRAIKHFVNKIESFHASLFLLSFSSFSLLVVKCRNAFHFIVENGRIIRQSASPIQDHLLILISGNFFFRFSSSTS